MNAIQCYWKLRRECIAAGIPSWCPSLREIKLQHRGKIGPTALSYEEIYRHESPIGDSITRDTGLTIRVKAYDQDGRTVPSEELAVFANRVRKLHGEWIRLMPGLGP
jgi:hypothetical protein